MKKDSSVKQSGGDYKSPDRKLITFFERSRNNWKPKCQDAKYQIKKLKKRLQYTEERKKELKNKVKALEKEVDRLQSRESVLQAEVDRLKKKAPVKVAPVSSPNFDSAIKGHSYSLGHVHMMLSLVLKACCSMRGSSRSAEVMFSCMEMDLQTPSWYSVRLWLLRLGLYKLTSAKEKAEDWIWIIDHTIQWGKEKCLAVLGVRQSSFHGAEMILQHEDVEPLALYPVTQSNGKVVYRQLEEVVKITGVPRQIVVDGGTDINSGIQLFMASHPETCSVYDIKHKAATLLKKRFSNDSAWDAFVKYASQAGKQLQQTEMAALAPPAQRTKARYMNIDRLVVWAHDLLIFLDRKQYAEMPEYCEQVIEKKLGWLNAYRDRIQEWHDIINAVDTVENFIRFHGVYRGCHSDIMNLEWFGASSAAGNAVQLDLIEFVKSESLKAKPNERLLASSEVIESLFGKLKYLEKDQAKGGFTGLLLAFGAFASKMTVDIVQKALVAVPTKKVHEWFKANIGKSVQTKRKEFKSAVRKLEHFQTQNLVEVMI